MDVIAKEHAQDQLWSKVDKALATAHAVMFDGCHKIYVITSRAYPDSNLYETHVKLAGVSQDAAAALDTLKQWWEASCGLRFITRIDNDGESNSDYTDLIEQGEQAFVDGEDDDYDDEVE